MFEHMRTICHVKKIIGIINIIAVKPLNLYGFIKTFYFCKFNKGAF